VSTDDNLTSPVVLGDRWQTVAVIGRGADGVVWRGTDLRTGREVAVKRYDPAAGWAGDALVDRLRRESARAARVRSPYLVQHLDYGTSPGPDGTPRGYTVMELLDGEDLRAALDRRVVEMRPNEVVSVVADVARGLAALHKAGYVYRDLKPENVLLLSASAATDADVSLKLIDLGAACTFEQARGAVARATPIYSAPELAQRHEEVGPAADVYALGVLLFELLTGKPPVDATRTPAQIVAQHTFGSLDPLPPPLSVRPIGTIYERATRRRPQDRFADADAFLQALASLEARPAPPPLRPPRLPSQSPFSVPGGGEDSTLGTNDDDR
jgi:serine/threonine-protein kinase